MGYLIVFLGGGLGAALRHGVNLSAARWFGPGFPYGTLTVNIAGLGLAPLLVALLTDRVCGDPAMVAWSLCIVCGTGGVIGTWLALQARREQVGAASTATD